MTPPWVLVATALAVAPGPLAPALFERFEPMLRPHRADFHQRFLRDGVVHLKFDDRPRNVSHGVFRHVDAYLRPRFARDKGPGAEVPWPEDGIPLSDPNGDYFYGGAPGRKEHKGYHTLAASDDTVQGPHQEMDMSFKVVLLFYCQTPASQGGGTGLFDMQRAWALLPRELQLTLRTSYWSLPGLDKIPCAVKHPRTGKPILIFYCFGRLARDCVDVYRERTGKYHVIEDPYTYGVREGDPLIVDAKGRARPFIGSELYKTLDCIYDSLVIQNWSEGEALVVDNIRWSHARLDGVGAQRKVHFAWYAFHNMAFSPSMLPRPSMKDVHAE